MTAEEKLVIEAAVQYVAAMRGGTRKSENNWRLIMVERVKILQEKMPKWVPGAVGS